MYADLAVGARVITRADVLRPRLTPDFPGWGTRDARKYFIETPEGMYGTITNISQHGIRPYTRYDVKLDDDTRLINAILGEDIDCIVT